MKVTFNQVDYMYVAEKILYEENFDGIFYLDDGDLLPVKTYKDFVEIYANELKVYVQSVKAY